jgi:DNA helicase-2/ATP-dependent DNA helicase PcrA
VSLAPSPEQQAILDLGLTTIRVRAGAGTGKTTTVAMVIANLIDHHGVEPEQILGITFTNKAAAELADRVRETLGSEVDLARQPEIHTYHGFAAQILAEFGPLAGVDNRSKVITPTYSRQLMSETFFHRRYTYLDITYGGNLDRIRALGNRLGDHLLTPEDLLEAGEEREDEVWMKRMEMAETLQAYNEEKRRLRVVDYADLITLSARIVNTHPSLAQAIRDRYRALILDEYQDTNPAQRILLAAIFGDGFPVVAVGDEDQTIYEWRGASARNFVDFPQHFKTPEGERAHERGLTLNRRSSQQILDIANEVRKQANPDADALQAVAGAGEAEVVTFWADDALEEAEWIARRYYQLHEAGTPWSHMAVLFRKNKDFAVVVEAMKRHDIPVEVANVGGLLSVPEVAELRAWLTVLDRPEDSAALAELLFGSRFRLGLADLAPLTRWAAGADDTDDREDLQPVTLLEAIDAVEDIEGLRPEAAASLIRFREIYRHLLTESQGLSLVETCRLVLDLTRAWQDIEALPPSARLTARLNIYRFLDLTEDWSPLRGRPSLGAFLAYLGAMEEEPADELDSARLSGEEAVTLVTVHRAKGLEWETVALPAVVRGNFPSKARQFADPERFPEEVPTELRIDAEGLPADPEERKEHLRYKHENQEWRVAYVALTRAKRRLLVSGAYWYGLPEPTKRPKSPSELFEIVAAHPHSRSEGMADLGTRPEILWHPPADPAPDPIFPRGWGAAIRDALSRPESVDARAEELGLEKEYRRVVEEISNQLFRLAEPDEGPAEEQGGTVSVTGLVTYAQCPKRFYWTDVDPLPRRPNPAALRGSEIHRRIELHQLGRVPFEEFDETLYDAVGEDGPKGGGFAAYEASRFAENKAALVEAAFSLDLETDYVVRGRIDAIYCDGPHWEVVDFKSGQPSEDPARMVQLQAYGVAATRVDFGLPRPEDLRLTFAYLGGGLHEETIEADKEWIEQAEATLVDLTSRIGREEFPEAPRDWCRSCDFLRFCGPGRAWVEEH